MRRLRTVVAFTTFATIACVGVALGASSATAPTATAAVAITPPSATTGAAISAGATSETVTGVVNPNGRKTSFYFEYGPTVNYGSNSTHLSAGAGTTNVPVTVTLPGLTPSGTYHYRLVAVSTTGKAVGTDQTFTVALMTSQVRVMGREGFVSPGGVIGVELGCFAGQTTCVGHIAMTHNGIVVGQHQYSIPPESGGFHNMKLTAQGQRLLRHNRVFHLLGVDVTVRDANGQTLNYVIHLARWVWH